MAFTKGNQLAAKPNRMFGDMLKRKFIQDPNKMARLVDKLIECAEEGQSWAMAEIANRLDGKPMQQVTLDATVENRNASELSDAALLAIAQGKQDEHVH